MFLERNSGRRSYSHNLCEPRRARSPAPMWESQPRPRPGKQPQSCPRVAIHRWVTWSGSQALRDEPRNLVPIPPKLQTPECVYDPKWAEGTPWNTDLPGTLKEGLSHWNSLRKTEGYTGSEPVEPWDSQTCRISTIRRDLMGSYLPATISTDANTVAS
jgi:hypothetical protein